MSWQKRPMLVGYSELVGSKSWQTGLPEECKPRASSVYFLPILEVRRANSVKHMRALIISTLVLGLLGSCAVRDLAQEKPDVASIRALELKWVDAYKQRQIAAVAALLADDYVITLEDGSTYGKVGFISYNARPLRVDIADLADVKIRMHENIAVVTAAYHERGELDGKPYDYHDRLTDVWMKIGGKWQLIASHYSLPANL